MSTSSLVYQPVKQQPNVSDLTAIIIFSLAGLVLTAALSWAVPLDTIGYLIASAN